MWILEKVGDNQIEALHFYYEALMCFDKALLFADNAFLASKEQNPSAYNKGIALFNKASTQYNIGIILEDVDEDNAFEYFKQSLENSLLQNSYLKLLGQNMPLMIFAC